MKTTFLIIAGIAIGIEAMAVEMSPSTRLRTIRQEAESRDDTEPPYRPLLLQVADEATVEELKEMGVIIFNRRDDILLSCIPVEVFNEALELPGLIVAETTGEITAMLDEARPYCSVDMVQQGLINLPQGYDGDGIVVGFSDIGFDAQHIAFKDRISAIYDYDAAYGQKLSAETPEAIAEWTTDNPDNYHGTHVGNILGGNYRGNGYYGVATGAEMVATTSRLTDVGILAGVEDIIAYAKKEGKRAVINLSLGNYLGAHDGSSLMCRYLESCAKDAVICLSAGNNGEISGYASAELDDEMQIYRVLVNSLATWDGFEVEGMTEFWSDTSNPFDFRIELWDKDSRSVVFATDWATEDNPQLYVDAEKYPEWGKVMGGYVVADCGVSPLNGRYSAAALYVTQTEETAANSDGRWSRYATALAFKKSDRISTRVHVDVFADAIESFIGSANAASSPQFSGAGSISDLCTAEGVIAVGNVATRNVLPSLEYGEIRRDFPIDRIAPSSAYSDVFTIPRLPHFAAPGRYVVSAMSSQYLEHNSDLNGYLAAVSEVDGKDYYWVSLSGTSMSSPLAAGIMAQWLQADNSLTPEQLIEIAQRTSRRDYPDIDNPRWGAGCIDALAGLESILQASAPVIEKDRGSCDVYTLQGIKVRNALADKLPRNLPAGIYIAGGKLVYNK